MTVIVSILLLFTTIYVRAPNIQAESTTLVYVDPEESCGALGQIFSVNVKISNVTDLAGFEYKLKWNSTLLQCINCEKCDPSLDLGWSVYWTAKDVLNPGEHWLMIIGGWGSINPFSGNATLATYTFRIMEIGECVLDIHSVKLGNQVPEPIPHTLNDGYFTFEVFEHDLAVFLHCPIRVEPSSSVLIEATVINDGMNNETNVEFQLLLNGSIVNSTVIGSLKTNSSRNLSCLWSTSTSEAKYNVTAYAKAVAGEELTANNLQSVRVLVSYAIKVPLDYQTIQEAIDAASSGDTILVLGGTYYEHLFINKPLTLVGEEGNIPIIDGNGTDKCIVVMVDNVYVAGFILRNGIFGIDVLKCDCATIIGNKMLNNDGGIALTGSNNNTIVGNTMLDNYIAIALIDSENNTVHYNNFLNSTHLQFAGWSGYNILDGNYWSDYEGLDVNGDNVGDTPYVIDANNQDEHPSTVPLDSVPIIWGETVYQVDIWSNSTIFEIDFLSQERVISFYIVGMNDTAGFCNITVPNSLIQDLWQGSYEVLVDGEQPLTIINSTDGKRTYVQFTYKQSKHEVTIIPEYSSLLVLPLLMIATLLGALVSRRLWLKPRPNVAPE